MVKYVLGVDPGLGGALAFLHPGGELVRVFDMPVMPNGKGKAKIKNQVNAAALLQMIHSVGIPLIEMVAWMEMVSSMPKDAQSIAFSLGDSVGSVRGVLAAVGIPLTLVRAMEWKRHFDLLKLDKDFARTKAQQLYPTAPLELKKHGGRADAILIARYGSVQP